MSPSRSELVFPFSERRRLCLVAAASLALAGRRSWAGALPPATTVAEPDTYRQALARLQAGQRLLLAPGLYTRGLPLHGLEGTRAAPITIEAWDAARPPIFLARSGANTVSLIDSRWLVLRALRFEGAGQRVDAIKAEGHARFADHIVLEGLSIFDHGPWQDVVGISTKCPAYGWVVRNNWIVGAGTGMYFGQSDGSAPFVAGLIEGNRVFDPVGYGIQIKHQVARGGPVAPQVTTLCRNRIVKTANRARGSQARPNLLIGHVPTAGPGEFDSYRVFGNLLFDNPTESLLQAEGNLAIYNNLLVNPQGDALRVMAHRHRPRTVTVFHNTVVARGLGIEISGGEPGYERSAMGNWIFAQHVVLDATAGNAIEPFARAQHCLVNPLQAPPALDLSPRAGALSEGAPLPVALGALPGARDDFLGRPRHGNFSGACAPMEPAVSARCA
ncbi:MAG: hypothetical protein RR412_08180 [Burkholderiaceae bacterium]